MNIGDNVKIKCGACKGLSAKIIAFETDDEGITDIEIELIEGHGVWKAGETLSVRQYELEAE